MMRIVLVIAFVIAGVQGMWAADVNLFPLSGINIAMSSAELLARYPRAKIAFERTDENGVLIDGLLLVDVQANLYWNSALIRIKDGEVQSLTYVRTTSFEYIRKNVSRIYKELVSELGPPNERRIAFHGIKSGKVRSPVFVWNRTNSLIAFSHSPGKEYKTGDLFICQLTIAKDQRSLQAVFSFAQGAIKGDHELFQESAGKGDGKNVE